MSGLVRGKSKHTHTLVRSLTSWLPIWYNEHTHNIQHAFYKSTYLFTSIHHIIH